MCVCVCVCVCVRPAIRYMGLARSQFDITSAPNKNVYAYYTCGYVKAEGVGAIAGSACGAAPVADDGDVVDIEVTDGTLTITLDGVLIHEDNDIDMSAQWTFVVGQRAGSGGTWEVFLHNDTSYAAYHHGVCSYSSSCSVDGLGVYDNIAANGALSASSLRVVRFGCRCGSAGGSELPNDHHLARNNTIGMFSPACACVRVGVRGWVRWLVARQACARRTFVRPVWRHHRTVTQRPRPTSRSAWHARTATSTTAAAASTNARWARTSRPATPPRSTLPGSLSTRVLRASTGTSSLHVVVGICL